MFKPSIFLFSLQCFLWKEKTVLLNDEATGAEWLVAQGSISSLLRLIRIWGSNKRDLTCTCTLLKPQAVGFFFCHHRCRCCRLHASLPRSDSLSVLSKSALWQLPYWCFVFFHLGPPSGPYSIGWKPLALFSDSTSHSEWKDEGLSYCLLSVTGTPSDGRVCCRSSQRCMGVNVLLDILLYWW